MKAVILAGGLGTRLRECVSGVPKPMAPIAGYPFLEILISNLKSKGISEIILSVGYRYEVIQDYFGNKYDSVTINYVIEEEPLGTGGALKATMKTFEYDEGIFVLNGDTFLDLNFREMKKAYDESAAEVGMALKFMHDSYRYGRVILDKNENIINFQEKGAHKPGLINAGVYLLKPSFLERFDMPQKFSLENDIFVEYLNEIKFYPFTLDGYFIDIGVPEDYARSQTELTNYF